MRVTLVVISCFLSMALFANPEKKGLAVAKKLEKANEGYVGESSKMKMVLINAHGAKTVREMKGEVLEVKSDGDKSLLTFINPRDVKGTKMLTWSHKKDDDDQWLYLPSFRRVKRISSSGKSSSFMGSEFSFEDLGSQEVEKFNFKLLSEDKNKWVLERIPKSKSGYSKQISHISKKYMAVTKVEYYDRKKELLKVASFDDFKKYTVKGKTLYRANKIQMKNVQTKKESIFTWENRKLGVNLKAKDFNKKSLK